VVLLQLIYQIQQVMYLGDRAQPKLVVIDEAWDLLTQGDVARFIETGYRRFRKYGGAAVTVTQSLNDLYSNPTGRAIAENSANTFLLAQPSQAIEQLQAERRLPMTEAGAELLKTVHTLPGAYSEIMVLTDRGGGIGRLVDPSGGSSTRPTPGRGSAAGLRERRLGGGGHPHPAGERDRGVETDTHRFRAVGRHARRPACIRGWRCRWCWSGRVRLPGAARWRIAQSWHYAQRSLFDHRGGSGAEPSTRRMAGRPASSALPPAASWCSTPRR
jgi:hypothetical protein